jgi:hypothetical protein
MVKSFEKWLTQEVETTFGIKRNLNMALLNDWLKATSTFTDEEKRFTEKIKNRLFLKADFWNEDELKMQFISLLLDVVDYTTSEKYSVFSQRTLSAEIQGTKVNGIVEYMLAQGTQIPSKPFFFFHEYKQETKKNSDPKGQLLISMLAAQQQNNTDFPLYGCYVVGRSWFFVILQHKEYAVSNAYNASDEDIYKIISILRHIKSVIETNF